jgi:protein-L-isoaspartate(D-aspartate) O-methyltransferase
MFGGGMDGFSEARHAMVEGQLRRRGIRSERLLEAMRTVPRHEFVPADFQSEAYSDKPVPIGAGQTISQPFMVVAMTETLGLTGTERVLEIGTGSGYQAAVISLLAREVFSIESHTPLALAALQRLARLGYSNVYVHNGDGSLGFADAAPYDAILVTAAAPMIPPLLADQLREGGCLAIPVGPRETQELLKARKQGGKLSSRVLFDCRFVPLLGRHGWNRDDWNFSA